MLKSTGRDSYINRYLEYYIIRATRVCEYSDMEPKGGEDFCLCLCVFLSFFSSAGISFQKPPETQAKQRSSEYASGDITQG